MTPTEALEEYQNAVRIGNDTEPTLYREFLRDLGFTEAEIEQILRLRDA